MRAILGEAAMARSIRLQLGLLQGYASIEFDGADVVCWVEPHGR